jgi:hypothetical protein
MMAVTQLVVGKQFRVVVLKTAASEKTLCDPFAIGRTLQQGII